MIRTVRILAVVALLTALLGHMILDRMMLLRDGKTIELEVVPVDPRSLFRGDYVILDYAISNINVRGLEGDKGFTANDLVFVTLIFDGENWVPLAAHKAPQPVKGDEVMIAGRVKWLRKMDCTPNPEAQERECRTVEDLQITYGIESFFVPEGIGRDLEDQRNAGALSVQVAIDEDGRAGIKSLLIDGRVLYEETLF